MAIKRRKTEEVRKDPNTGIDCVVWELELDGEVIGSAVATYKTPTQRTWDATATVDGVTAKVEGAFSISKAIEQINAQLSTSATPAASKPAKAAKKVKVTPAPAATETEETESV